MVAATAWIALQHALLRRVSCGGLFPAGVPRSLTSSMDTVLRPVRPVARRRLGAEAPGGVPPCPRSASARVMQAACRWRSEASRHFPAPRAPSGKPANSNAGIFERWLSGEMPSTSRAPRPWRRSTGAGVRRGDFERQPGHATAMTRSWCWRVSGGRSVKSGTGSASPEIEADGLSLLGASPPHRPGDRDEFGTPAAPGPERGRKARRPCGSGEAGAGSHRESAVENCRARRVASTARRRTPPGSAASQAADAPKPSGWRLAKAATSAWQKRV